MPRKVKKPTTKRPAAKHPAKSPEVERMQRRLDRMKRNVAKELGLWAKVRAEGWGGLTAAESGRVGGIMTHRLRHRRSARAMKE